MTLPAPLKRKRWYERAIQTVYDHLVVPFLQTHDKLNRVAWGAALGTFTGLTPTVGVQMYLVTMLWALCRYVFRLRFNLTIAVSMVWITNPVTTIPIYFLFLKTGDLLLGALGYEVRTMTFAVFRAEVAQFGAGQQLDWLHWIIYATQVLWVEFGWPIMMGSLVYAVPLGLLAYPFTRVTLKRYRRYLAQQQGISYEAWRERYEVRH